MSKKNIISAAIIGNIVEYYDFGLYAVFAEVLGRLYFPQFNKDIQIIFSFTIFAIGFLMRPLGGIIFGHIGDILGRKISLTISIIGMGISTLIIGIMPTYQQIGIIAPVLLTTIRMFQGLCIGGEGPGSAIFVIEHFKEKKIGLIGSFIMSSNVIGTLLAITVGIIIDNMIKIDNFTWRYGFFLGGFMGIIGLYVRKQTVETPVFKNLKLKKRLTKLPLLVILKERWQNILLLASFAGVATSNTYMIRGFFSVYFAEIIALSKQNALYIVAFSLVTVICTLPIFGYFVDKVNCKKYVYVSTIILIIVVIPIFSTFSNNQALENIYFSIFIFGILVSSTLAPYYPFAIKFFSPELRYSGIALSWNLGNAIFGGTTPVLATFLVMKFGCNAPAYYLSFIASLFLLISLLNKKIL